MWRYGLIFSPLLSLQAIFVDNPAAPSLQTESLLFPQNRFVSLRTGYVADYIYRQRFQELQVLDDAPLNNSFIKSSSNGLQITLNLLERLDLSAMIGYSVLDLDHNLLSSSTPTFGGGIKALLVRWENWCISFDAKYMYTEYSSLSYLISQGLVFPMISPLALTHTELQGAFGIAFLSPMICPYLHLTYLSSEITPLPAVFLVETAAGNPPDEATFPSIHNRTHWGVALGASFIQTPSICLTLESRLFNQNALHLNLEMRY